MASPPGARTIAAIVTAPLSIGVRAVENAPEIVGRVRQELTLARFVGKLAVDQGRRELQRRLDGDPGPNRRTAGTATADVSGGLPDDGAPGAASAGDTSGESGGETADVPDAGDLALENYDQLPAAQVVAMLAGLTPTERERIGHYEAAHRHRRTVLGKLEQLDR